jgi:hypothetical protein
MKTSLIAVAVLVFAGNQACRHLGAPEAVALAPGEVARVAGHGLSAAYLRGLRVEGGKVGPWVQGWVESARWSALAVSAFPDAMPTVRRGLLGSALHAELVEESLRKAPLSASELDAAASRAWAQVDRPRAVRAVSLGLRVGPLEDERAVFARLQGLLAKAPPSDPPIPFLEAVNAEAQSQGITLEIEAWPPTTEDGRVVPRALGDDPTRALPDVLRPSALALQEPGQISPILSVARGFYVTLAIEIVPSLRLDPRSREAVTRPLALAERLAPTWEKLKRRAPEQVRISPQASAFMKLAWRTR